MAATPFGPDDDLDRVPNIIDRCPGTYGAIGVDCAPGVIRNEIAPKVTGKTKVGKTLTASPGTWSVTGLTVKYRWLREGNVIRGATAKSYRLSKASKGHRISVRVTVSCAGYTTVSKTSAPTVEIR